MEVGPAEAISLVWFMYIQMKLRKNPVYTVQVTWCKLRKKIKDCGNILICGDH